VLQEAIFGERSKVEHAVAVLPSFDHTSGTSLVSFKELNGSVAVVTSISSENVTTSSLRLTLSFTSISTA
jgi:hypothetical protein